MNWKRVQTFRIFLLSVVLVFLYARPLNSPWSPFIAGDGLGYYAYLPATFIYHDTQYDYKWFNKAHDANYVYSTFPNPEDNLLVKYGDKRINKYYQGLAIIWLPFFVAGHLVAGLTHYPADGFSLPYQWCIALASLVYLLLGLVYLRKLLLRLFADELAANLTPVAIFYGAHLYTYAIHANSLSHAYSFTFITLFVYFLVAFFQDGRSRYLLWCLLCFVICCCIRPMTGLILAMVPALWPARHGVKLRGIKLKAGDLLLLALTALVLVFQVTVTWIQTGSLVAYTYSGEKFIFDDPHFFDALLSYHIGLFVYVPVFFIALFGAAFLPTRQRVIVPGLFLGLLFLYSCWWYWPITKRAMVDFYVLPAILLASLLSAYKHARSRWALLALVVLSIVYFQFKNMQVRKGILDEYATYKEVFWRNFFRTRKANMYLVPPHTIVDKEEHTENFDGPDFAGNLSGERSKTGKSLLLDSAHYISPVAEYVYPALMRGKGVPKVRFSFNCYAEGQLKSVHVFMQFIDQAGKVSLEVPFYLNADAIFEGLWDYKEFGYELTSEELRAYQLHTVKFTIWNVEGRGRLYVDDAKVEFMLTDRSFETMR